MPTDKWHSGIMIGAKCVGPAGDRLGDLRQCSRDIARRGRAAHLIADNREFIAFATQAQHRADEIRAVGAEDPRRPENDMTWLAFADRQFPGQLARAIGRKRRAEIGFTIGVVGSAVEHVIGGNMEEGDSGRSGRGSHFARCIRIQRECSGSIALGFVDRGVSSGIYDQIGPMGRDCSGRGSGQHQVTIVTTDKSCAPILRPYKVCQLAGDLPGFAKNQDMHDSDD